MHMSFAAAVIAAAAAFTAPATARVVQLVVNGTITSGSDAGTDLIDVNVINNVYVETFGPGSFFGSPGGLTGKSVVLRLLYDTAAAALPVPVGGLFDDPSGEWAYTLAPVVTVGGVAHDFIDIVPGTFAFGTSAALGLVDGAPDGLTGNFHSLTFSGNNISDFRISAFAFTAALPPGFFSTDAVLPGAVAAPHSGFAHGIATGTGSFNFTRQTCFFTCSSKTAAATFNVSSVAFAAVPEPAAWALMVIGFGGVGAMARRRGTQVVVTA